MIGNMRRAGVRGGLRLPVAAMFGRLEVRLPRNRDGAQGGDALAVLR
jgi:hypothetical protein